MLTHHLSRGNISMSTATLPSNMNDCEKPSRKPKCSQHLRLRDRSNTMTGRLMPFHWRQVTWSWLKLISTRGRGKWRASWRRNYMEWNTELLKESLCALWKTSGQDAHESSTKTDFFSSLLPKWTPLCMVMPAEQAQCTTTTLEEQSPKKSENEEVPWGVNCLLPAQQQTVETPLGWVNRKLCAILQMFPRMSLLDQG